ncbi:MAG TPA: hypothetical protein VLA48_02965 [Nitrososphaeraceae archaeon]|nr:hypothetical protein [Nitrososphaeraceae archaeon]
MWKEITVIICGCALLIFSISSYENSKSAQKIENIDKLYRLKTELEKVKSMQETDSLIKDTERLIDSMNNIK